MGATKRQLDFRSADEVIAEIERLDAAGYTRTKRWNLSQICEHLTKTMVGEMNGLGFRIPRVLRKTVGVWFTHRILKRRTMPSVPTLPSLKPTVPSDEDSPAAIERCIETLKQSAAFEGSLDDYPFVDGLTHEQWRQFMWIHAAHHLGFLVPIGSERDESSE